MNTFMTNLLATAILTGCSLFFVFDCHANDSQGNIKNGRAISLKVLQKRAKDCMASRSCNEHVLNLSGIKKVVGFVIDKEKNDIILIGKTDENSPPLQLEDFIIALRNEWMIYAKLEGTTYYYSPPGCTIDPDPEVLNVLQLINNPKDSAPNPELAKRRTKQWYEVCQKPQKVEVFGVPHNTHFSKVMVDADYYMKKITNGLVDLNIPGFTSLSDLRLNIVKSALKDNQQIDIPAQSMNRFWFYPGENSYLEDKGNVFIKECKVKLLTEEEFLTKSGAIAATGHTDILAQDFADKFTKKYEQIAKKESIYTELEALYRFVVISKLIKNNDALTKANFSIDYFLREFPITYTYVDPTLPGIPNVNVLNTTNGYISTLSCGGVSIDMSAKILNIVKDYTKYLSNLSNRILKARLFPNALYWDF